MRDQPPHPQSAIPPNPGQSMALDGVHPLFPAQMLHISCTNSSWVQLLLYACMQPGMSAVPCCTRQAVRAPDARLRSLHLMLWQPSAASQGGPCAAGAPLLRLMLTSLGVQAAVQVTLTRPRCWGRGATRTGACQSARSARSSACPPTSVRRCMLCRWALLCCPQMLSWFPAFDLRCAAPL